MPPPQVVWLHPLQLLRTQFYALLSTFGTGLLDRRDVQAAHPVVFRDEYPAITWLRGTDLSEPTRATTPAGDVDSGADFLEPTVELRGKEVWIDYVADIGDSWDATFATLSLLARRFLPFRLLPDSALHAPVSAGADLSARLPRAHVVVLGGDLVYPTPVGDAYRTRTISAFMAAFPEHAAPTVQPTLLTIPGNHDWYDGLTAFTREFCQGRSIGAWRTVQGRSYFAVKLPSNWWLFGIDIALESRVDAAQQRYFVRLLTEQREIRGSSRQDTAVRQRIILCTARPVWLEGPYRTAAAYRNLAEFADLLRSHGAETTVILAGDTHHYSHYVATAPAGAQAGTSDEHMFVVGGGGSYLSATHDLRPVSRKVTPRPRSELPLGDAASSVPGQTTTQTERQPLASSPDAGSRGALEEEAAREARRARDSKRRFMLSPLTYPSGAASRRMVWGALRTPIRVENIPFMLMVGLLYVAFASLWYTVGDAPPVFVSDHSVREQIAKVLDNPPWVAWTFGAMLTGLCAWFAVRATEGLRWFRVLWGSVHGAVHLVAALWLLAWILAACDPAHDRCVPLVPWLAPFRNVNLTVWHLVFVATGGLLGTTIFSLYLVLSERLLGWHTNEVFMMQSLIDYRSFLRMRLDPDGTLTIYPIGLRETPTQWRARAMHPCDPLDEDNPSLYQPGNGTLDPVLIEAPIRIGP